MDTSNTLFENDSEYEEDEEIEEAEEDDGEDEEYDTEYRPSVAWDLKTGDFVRDGANRLVKCDGKEAFMIWCVKMACTQRDAHMAYMEEVTGYDLGADIDEALSYEDQSSVETALEDTEKESIEVNPRTEYVGDFSFTWEGDNVHPHFVVKGLDWEDEIAIDM